MDLNKTQIGTAPTLDPNKTIMGSGPSLNATQTIQPVQCPVCKTFNPPGVMFCVDCGLIFDQALPPDAFGAAAVQLPVLVDSAGREHILRPGSQVIGRAGDLMIEDSRISRRHARLTLEGMTVNVEDMGSTNGTKVNGTALAAGSPSVLGSGGKLSLGGYELTLSLPGEAAKTSMPAGGRTAAISAPTVAEPVADLVGDGSSYPLVQGENTFGRRDGNMVKIADPYVSGSHGVIEVTEQAVFVIDTGSTNGTVIGEEKLEPQAKRELAPEESIRLGALEFRVVRRG